MDKLKRYIIFFIGLFINSLGVSLITKAALGTSPISSIPYVLCLSFPFTLGQFTIFFSLLLVLFQLIILRRNFKAEHLLQIPISMAFGYFIDLTMDLFSFVDPKIYIVKFFVLLIGCLILDLGVYTEVLANVAMLPGESFVRAVVKVWHTEFGISKVVFDVSLSLIAVVLSFVVTGHLEGVREGTIIAALFVGFIARTLGRLLKPLETILLGTPAPSDTDSAISSVPNTVQVIAIGRQYSSGGHDLGQELAERLGYTFYDKDIIKLAAGTTGYSTQYIAENEESMTNSLLYDLVNQMYTYRADSESPKGKIFRADSESSKDKIFRADSESPKDKIFRADSESLKDKIFRAESETIKTLAAKENCVIVGRAADYVLRDDPNCLKIFFHASANAKTQRILERKHLSSKDAEKKVAHEEKLRAANYRYYTHRMWGFADDYDLSLDTAIGIDRIEQIVRTMLDN